MKRLPYKEQKKQLYEIKDAVTTFGNHASYKRTVVQKLLSKSRHSFRDISRL